jgi:DNA-binding SARP family transcriptional activator
MTLPQALRCEALCDDVIVRFSPMCHELLTLLLLSSPKRLLTLTTIVEVLWPDPDIQPLGATNRIHKCMMQLRRAGVDIEGQHGRGWRIPESARGVYWRRAA